MIVDPIKIADLIKDIADEEISKRFGRLQDDDIDTKTGPNDFVTLADRAAEERLRLALRDLYPAAGFVGEEGVAADPATLDALCGDGAFWIVDPLDGTRNFVQSRPEFGTIVALIEDGEIRQGWIYAIPDRKIAIASLGDGVQWAGGHMTPLPRAPFELKGYRAIGNIDENWKPTIVANMRAHLKTETVRCAAYVYLSLLRGESDFALYSRCSPWDHAAGVLMLNEIGGEARYLDTDEAYAPVMQQGRPLLVAGSNDRWRRVHDRLMPAASAG